MLYMLWDSSPQSWWIYRWLNPPSIYFFPAFLMKNKPGLVQTSLLFFEARLGHLCYLYKGQKRNIESRTKDKTFFSVIIFLTREYFRPARSRKKRTIPNPPLSLLQLLKNLSLVWFLCPLRRRKVQRFYVFLGADNVWLGFQVLLLGTSLILIRNWLVNFQLILSLI